MWAIEVEFFSMLHHSSGFSGDMSRHWLQTWKAWITEQTTSFPRAIHMGRISD
jgi:hypothetical protein